ncbi:MAG TPA: Fic family protein [Candidatus Angelobacter sp.]|nr:Fic family protein [Candidatus Angelobacter sp.]
MVLTWEPITDLPPDWSSLTDGELGPLLQFWNDQRTDLEQTGALAEFNKRLGREWSIETGQIEGVYNLDLGITETLIERGIDADLIGNLPGQKPPEIIAAIIQDHADVLEGLFQFVKGSRPLSKSYIHELHAALLRHQETTAVRDQFGNLFEAKPLKGKYKERPNNPKKPDGSMHQYCPPEQVDSEMEKLLSLHAEHEKKGVPVEVEAAWLHHRFTQIHPYQDGNGRVARALASLLFIKTGWFPVVVTREDRGRYIDVLEAGDEGALIPLISFLIDIQKAALFQATQTTAEFEEVHTVQDAIAAAKRALTASKLDPSVWRKSSDTANRLIEIAARRLGEILAEMNIEGFHISCTYEPVLNVSSEMTIVNDPDQFDPFYRASDVLDYEPNIVDYHQARGVKISTGRQTFIELNAHAIGSKFRGLIGMVVLFGSKESRAHIASLEPFQVNYAESSDSAERRFRPWLEESLVNALTLWRKSL